MSAGEADDAPPERLDAAILFAPAGDLVPVALGALDHGGVLVIAGIHLSDIPPLRYAESLFEERGIRSVTANTHADGATFLQRAAEIEIAVSTTTFRFEDANSALVALANDEVNGAAVLVMDESPRVTSGIDGGFVYLWDLAGSCCGLCPLGEVRERPNRAHC